MPIPVPAPSFQPISTLELVKSAMFEINYLAAGENPSAEDAAWGLQKLQRLIDKLNAVRQAIYSVLFSEFSLIANHAPHTIGPDGDFNVTPRPVRISSAAFILNAGITGAVDSPIHIRDKDWWAALPVKNLTSSISTDLYYSPDMPLGNCNFWPICDIANPVRLQLWSSIIVPLQLADLLSFPQGYWDAIVLSLAVEMCSATDKEPTPTLALRQLDAMRIIMGNNALPPRIRTDNSMPNSGGAGRPDFDFLTGLNDN